LSSDGADTIPLSLVREVAALGRRTRRLRLVLAALVCAAAAAAFLVALHTRSEGAAVLPNGTNGIVVLDVSASISSDTYARISTTLHDLARSHGRFGLVLFSDTAYQTLPPGTPSANLLPFARFFDVPPQASPGLAPSLPPSPWSDSFSAGTHISAGLQRALDVVTERHLRRPSVLLVSDLDDDTGDLQRLTDVALAYRHAGIPLRVVGLNPAPEDAHLVASLLSRPGDLRLARLPGEGGTSFVAHSAWPLALLTIAAGLLLGLFVPLADRLRWRPA
jgi:VWA domain containing CoxE-like protein